MRRWLCGALLGYSCCPPLRARALLGDDEPQHADDLAAAETSKSNGLRAWLRSLYIPVPGNASSLLDGGSCSGLQVGSVTTADVGTPSAPELWYQFLGLGLRCTILTRNSTMTTEFSFVDSEVSVRVAAELLWSNGGELALPIGHIRVTDCTVGLHVADLKFSGSSELATGLHTLETEISAMVQKAAPTFICNGLKDVLSGASGSLHDQAEVAADKLARAAARPQDAPPTPTAGAEQRVDWGAYPVLPFASALMAERGDVIIPAAVGTGPFEVHFPEGATTSWSGSAPNFSWSVAILSVRLEGLSSLRSDQLVLAGQGERLDVAVRLGQLRAAVQVGLGLETPSSARFWDSLTLTLGLENISLALQVMAAASRPRLDGLYADQLQRPECLASCTRGVATPGSAPVSVLEAAPGLSMPTLGAAAGDGLQSDLAALLETTGVALLSATAGSADTLVAGAAGLARERLNQELGAYMGQAPPCGATNVYRGPGPLTMNALLIFSIALPLAAAYATVASGFSKFFVKRATLSATLQESTGRERIPPCNNEAAAENLSLCGHPVVPALVSNVFPFFAAGVGCMFLYSDLKPGIEVNVFFSAGGDDVVEIGPVFSFSLWNSFTNAVHADSPLLAFFIIVFSGVWPLAKLVLLVAAWLMPEARLSSRARGRLLLLLDDYGKLSLVDSWMAVLGDSCYRIWFDSAERDTRMWIQAEPSGPFFLFIVATVVSMVMGHLASELHRRAEECNSWSPNGLEDHALERQVSSNTGQSHDFDSARPLRAFAPRSTSVAVVTGLALNAAVIVAGVYVNCLTVVLSGLMANAILDAPDLRRSLSVVSLAAGITEDNPGSASSMLLQATFVFFAVVVPLALAGSLAVLWLAPLRRGAQATLLLLCRALSAWAALDVFALAALVAHLTYSRLAAFMTYFDALSVMCGAVKDYLQVECFGIDFELLPGFAVLAVAGMLSVAIPALVISVCQAAVDHREIADSSVVSETTVEESLVTNLLDTEEDEDQVPYKCGLL